VIIYEFQLNITNLYAFNFLIYNDSMMVTFITKYCSFVNRNLRFKNKVPTGQIMSYVYLKVFISLLYNQYNC
jgi:hypothetical protein